MQHMSLLLMTSRSGSSMVADIFVKHGFYWAKDTRRNPLVGGKKVRYNSFENQTVKSYLKGQFGTPLGDMITYDDTHSDQFAALLRHEFEEEIPNVWKGAVEFFPLWFSMYSEGHIENLDVYIVYRKFESVIESVLAKRQGRGSIDEARAITQKRYDIMHDLASEYAAPLVMTDELIQGDYSSLTTPWQQSTSGIEFDRGIAAQVIKPQKWETDR